MAQNSNQIAKSSDVERIAMNGSDSSASLRTMIKKKTSIITLISKSKEKPVASTSNMESSENNLKKQKGTRESQHDYCTFDESPKSVFNFTRNNALAKLEKVYDKVPDRLLISNEKGETLLHVAAAEGHLNIVHFLLDTAKLKIDDQDFALNTPLHYAVLNSKQTVIDYLILKGAKADILNDRLMAPIHVATNNNLVLSLTELLKHRVVDPNLPGENDSPPLHFAAANNNVECTKLLLEKGACPCKPDASGLHSVHIAAKNGAKEVLEILVLDAAKKGNDRNFFLNCPDRDGNVPLHAAVDSGNLDAVRICLEVGAEIDAQQEDRSTPVHFACTRNELEMLKLMFTLQPDKKRRTINLRDASGMAPLHRAALVDNYQIAEYLLDQGADTELSDLNGRTALLVAASASSSYTINILMKHGANIFHRDNEGRNFIHLAVLNRTSLTDFKVETGSALAEKMRILLNERDGNGSTPLHYASGDGRLQAIERLLLDGAEITIRNNDRDTALHFAARHGRYNSCRRLLESPQGPFIINVQDWNGCSAMFLAAQNGHTRVVDLFLLKGALFHRNHAGETALHAAAREGHSQTVQLLVGSNSGLLNAVAICGKTALHFAAGNGHVSTVALLLDCHAQLLLTRCGKSFLHEAIFKGQEKVVEAILKHDRWREAMSIGSPLYPVPTKYLIESMPRACVILLDNCTKSNGKPTTHYDYSIEYDFQFIEEFKNSKTLTPFMDPVIPLPALNLMVQHCHLELLAHPCSLALLKMKWECYGRFSFNFRFLWWMFYVIAVTYFVVLSNPLCHTLMSLLEECEEALANKLSPAELNRSNQELANETLDDNQNNTNITNCYSRFKSKIDTCNLGKSADMRICKFLLLIILSGSLASTIRLIIFRIQKHVIMPREFLAVGISRYITLTLTIIFYIPIVINGDDYVLLHWQWNIGFLAMFTSWIHFFLFLQLQDTLGIYVVMFIEILKTLLKASFVFVVLLCGYGFTFHALLKYEALAEPIAHSSMTPTNDVRAKKSANTPGLVALSAFKTPLLSIFKVLLMMTGELDFLDTFVVSNEDENNETLHFSFMAYFILLFFIITVPIVVMNLLLGLALGNIEGVLKNANLKKICMQVRLLTELERTTHSKILNLSAQKIIYVNRPNSVNTLCIKAILVHFIQKILKRCGSRRLPSPPDKINYTALFKQSNTQQSPEMTKNNPKLLNKQTKSDRNENTETKFTKKEICILLERQTEMLRSVMQHLKIEFADLEELEDDQLASYLNSRDTNRSKVTHRNTGKSASILPAAKCNSTEA